MHRLPLPFVLAGSLLLLASSVDAAVGSRPADFTLRSATGTEWRGTFRLRDHLGERPVVITFFSTWCRPCEQELPLLQRAWERYDGELVVVAIAIDGPQTAARIGPVTRRLGLEFPVVHDRDSSVTSRYNPRRALPFTVLVNDEGVIVDERASFTASDRRTLPRQLHALVQ